MYLPHAERQVKEFSWMSEEAQERDFNNYAENDHKDNIVN